MKLKAFLIIAIICLSVNCRAGIILPDDNFVTGWTTSGKTLRFSSGDLFNYIDGGAELFLEFGFKQLLVQNYQQRDNQIVLEVYQMKNPIAALGIYLIKCGDETPIEKIPARNSGNKYQFTIVKGSYFIQINSFAGDEKLIPIMTSLAQQTLKFIPTEPPVTIFEQLPKQDLVPGSELIVCGPYGLQPIYTFGEGDILQLQGKVIGVIGDYSNKQYGRYSRLVFNYQNSEEAQSAFQHLLLNLDPYLQILDQYDNGFIFKDFEEKFGKVRLNRNSIEIIIKLKQRPQFSRKY